MNCHPYDDRDGMKVWLDEQEVQLFLSKAKNTKQEIAFSLGVRSGLRTHEIVDVRAKDVVGTSAGPRVRVMEGKGDKYRETVATADLYRTSRVLVDAGGYDPNDELVPNAIRTVRQWVYDAAETLAEETGDENWHHLGPHDLRRTWATQMVGRYKVDPLLVCDYGGWADLKTFLEHYRGIYSPEVQRRELSKVDWLDIEEDTTETRAPETVLLEG